MECFAEIHEQQRSLIDSLLEECNSCEYVLFKVDLSNRKACVYNKSGVLENWHYDDLDKCWR